MNSSVSQRLFASAVEPKKLAGGMAFTATIAQTAALLFWLVALAKLLDIALGYSIEVAAYRTLFQALPAEQNVQAQNLADGVVQPLTSGLAGLALFALF